MKKKFTIRDIAIEAGVSPATVSLVLNGKGEISTETRTRVLEAVAQLEYVPRVPKGAVEAVETLRFLKIAKHGHTVNRDHSVFISDYIDGMSAEASRRKYKLEVVSFEGQPVSAIAESLAGAPVSGVIALGTELSEQDIRMIQAIGLPAVFLDTFYDVIDANFVNMNNEDAVYKVLSRFRDSGFGRIGFIASYVETTNFKLRRDAFFKNITRLGLKSRDEDVLSIESTYDGAYSDMVELLRSGIDLAPCYFCTNDVIAYGVIRALREFNIRVPQDVAVIGFDNLPQSATMEPALTTIEVSKRKIGNLAVTVLDDVIKSQDRQPPIKVLVGAELIIRASDLPASAVNSGVDARPKPRKNVPVG
jgi:LacI family transcriptional regulator